MAFISVHSRTWLISGSYFLQISVHEREWTRLTFCSRSRSFHVHFSFTEYPRNHSQGWNKIIFILFHPILLRIHKNRLPFKLLLHFEKKMLSTFFHFWSIKMLYYDRLVNVNWTWVNAQIFWALKSSRTWVNVAHNFKQMNVSDLAHEKCERAHLCQYHPNTYWKLEKFFFAF